MSVGNIGRVGGGPRRGTDTLGCASHPTKRVMMDTPGQGNWMVTGDPAAWRVLLVFYS